MTVIHDSFSRGTLQSIYPLLQNILHINQSKHFIQSTNKPIHGWSSSLRHGWDMFPVRTSIKHLYSGHYQFQHFIIQTIWIWESWWQIFILVSFIISTGVSTVTGGIDPVKLWASGYSKIEVSIIIWVNFSVIVVCYLVINISSFTRLVIFWADSSIIKILWIQESIMWFKSLHSFGSINDIIFFRYDTFVVII